MKITRIRLKRSKISHPIVREYEEAMARGLRSQHIFPSKDGHWVVRKFETKKGQKVFESKEAALSHAKELTKNLDAFIFIHDVNGSVLERL